MPLLSVGIPHNIVFYNGAKRLVPNTETWLHVGISEDLFEAILKASNREDHHGEKHSRMNSFQIKITKHTMISTLLRAA